MNRNKILKVAFAVCGTLFVLSLAYSMNLWNIRGVRGSEEYMRYRHADGVRAVYVEDHLWGDSIRADMTLLEAADTAGWTLLCNDFGLQPQRDSADIRHLDAGKDILEVFLTPDGGDIAVASHRDSYICLFHVYDTVQWMSLFTAIYDKVFYSITNKQNFLNNEEDI